MSDLPDLAALREKAEKATPGPWLKGDNYLIGGWWVIAPELPAREDCHRTIVDMVVRREDAVYVAAASPDVILAVLALVEEQRARISTLEEERDKWRRLYVAKMNEGLAFAIETAETYPADEAPELHAALRDLGEALAGSPAENKEPT